MEKLIYALSRRDSESKESFSKRLVTELGPKLMQQGAPSISVAVNDADVAAAEKLRIVNREPVIEAVICIWVYSANEHRSLATTLGEYATNVGGYLVTESEPLRNPNPASSGERTPGMMQIAFLQIPEGMNKNEWYSIWRDEHTSVAIETQSTLVYRQNLVVRKLTKDAPDCSAIVEEAFPAEAMSSQHAFYDAVGDDEKFEQNRRRMWESSKRFVDLNTIEVVPASEYLWGFRGD